MEKKGGQMSRSTFLNLFTPLGPLRVAAAVARGEKPPHTALVGTGLQAGVVLGLMGLSGCKPNTPDTAPQPPVVPTSTEVDISSLRPFIQEGFNLRSEADSAMLSGRPWRDLTYFENPAVKTIRAVPDKTERFMKAIGWLDVMRSKRYNDPELYTCNIYTLDLLRLLLGNEVIGSIYNESNGNPGVFGPDMLEFPAGYLSFNSNNLDGWMKQHGSKRYGWRQVGTQDALKQSLKAGAVALGVSSKEYIDAERAKLRKQEIDKGLGAYSLPDFTGHAFTLVDGKGCFVLSQSTENIQARGYRYDTKNQPKVLPEDGAHTYNFWVHDVPTV